MLWVVIESVLPVLAAAALGLAAGWYLGRRSSAAAATADRGSADALAAAERRTQELGDEVARLRTDLTGRWADIVRLTDERETAIAAHSRSQVNLAGVTAQLITRNEEFDRFRTAVRDRFGDEPEIPPPPPREPLPDDEDDVLPTGAAPASALPGPAQPAPAGPAPAAPDAGPVPAAGPERQSPVPRPGTGRDDVPPAALPAQASKERQNVG